MKKSTVTVIPAIPNSQFPQNHTFSKRRVAAYARVSTDSEEQLNSYEAQVDFYTGHIQSNPEWQFVRVYADEGISATNTKHRDGFNEMVADALAGKIDLIITKSVSRFARNTVDSLTTVRKLKEKGVEVYFEKENIYTLDSKGELLITIMSSIAQEESRSISENTTWGQRKRMADGKVSMAYKRFLGYEKGPDGTPVIAEEQAKTVSRIYALFLEGKTLREICAILTGEGIPTPAGKAQWRTSTVKSILTNEKYTGNAILQKRFTVDFLTKTTKVNEGEVPQFYVQNSHPAIIDPATFDLAQDEMARRGTLGKQFKGNGLFFCKIRCGDCGGFYGSKIWHSADKYRRVVWQCNRKYGEKLHCSTPHLTEEQIQQYFVEAFNLLLADKARFAAEYEAKAKKLANVSALDKQIALLKSECAAALDSIQVCIKENAYTMQDQEAYAKRYDKLTCKYKAAQESLDAVTAERQTRLVQAEKIRRFCALFRKSVPQQDFDPQLWCAVAETLTVRPKHNVSVTFRGGAEIHLKRG